MELESKPRDWNGRIATVAIRSVARELDAKIENSKTPRHLARTESWSIVRKFSDSGIEAILRSEIGRFENRTSGNRPGSRSRKDNRPETDAVNENRRASANGRCIQ